MLVAGGGEPDAAAGDGLGAEATKVRDDGPKQTLDQELTNQGRGFAKSVPPECSRIGLRNQHQEESNMDMALAEFVELKHAGQVADERWLLYCFRSCVLGVRLFFCEKHQKGAPSNAHLTDAQGRGYNSTSQGEQRRFELDI
jgi:hypothetical protein